MCKTKFFFFYFKKNFLNKSGRNNSGKIVVYTKTTKKYKIFSQNSYNAWSKLTSVIFDFKWIYHRGLFFLIKYVNGSISLIKSIFGNFLGDFLNNFFFLNYLDLNVLDEKLF